jgi:hypothetical protein
MTNLTYQKALFAVRAPSVLAIALLSAACGSDGDSEGEVETGTVVVRAYGESFIEDGIASEELGDGWQIEFQRFEVEVRDIVVADVELAEPDPVDVSAASGGDGHELGRETVAVGRYTEPSFTLGRVEVEGSAQRGETTKTFHWTFEAPTRYSRCDTRTEVSADETATFQITIHADHLFYDSLVAEVPQLLFDAFADADTDADGEITPAELAETDIGAYDPGNEDIGDLWAWLVAQHRTLGHVDGEGHCQASATD